MAFDFNNIEDDQEGKKIIERTSLTTLIEVFKNGSISADNLKNLGESLINIDSMESDKYGLELDLLRHIAFQVSSDKELLIEPIPSNDVVRTLGKGLLYRSAAIELHKKRGYLDSAHNHRLSESELDKLFAFSSYSDIDCYTRIYHISDNLIIVCSNINPYKLLISKGSELYTALQGKKILYFERECNMELAGENIQCELISFRGIFDLHQSSLLLKGKHIKL